MSVSVTVPSAVGVGPFLSRSRRRRRLTMALRSDTVSVGPSRMLTKLKHECATPLPLLQQVADTMSAEMRAGLASDVGPGPGLPMIPTYVDTLPTGYVSMTLMLFFWSFCFYWLVIAMFSAWLLVIGMRKGCFMHWILVEPTSVCWGCNWVANMSVSLPLSLTKSPYLTSSCLLHPRLLSFFLSLFVFVLFLFF